MQGAFLLVASGWVQRARVSWTGWTTLVWVLNVRTPGPEGSFVSWNGAHQ